ncbi:MAG: hypothetical protein ABIJ84_04500 [bacterium]
MEKWFSAFDKLIPLEYQRKEVKERMAGVRDPGTNVTRIQLCGVQGCCPVVEIFRDSDKVVISDDDGGKVTLTKKQWREALAKATLDT